MNTNIYPLSEFSEYDSAYWGLGESSNGTIYFALCSHQPGESAGLFSFNPKTNGIKKIITLTDALHSIKSEQIQGKIHTPLFEGSDEKLYFGSHFAYPFGVPQEVKYEGGHVLAYDPRNENIDDSGIPVQGEGILSLILDKERMCLYMLTAPSAYFVVYDITNKKFTQHGKIGNNGSICRSLVIDNEGNVYGSFEPNGIFKYDIKTAKLEILPLLLPDAKDAIPEWSSASRGGVNKIGRKIWRSAIFHPETKKIYGIHGATSNLFAFDPQKQTIQENVFMATLKDENNKNNIYPTLSLGLYKDRIFYAPASGFFDFSRSEKIADWTHLMIYDIYKEKVVDKGEIINDNKRHVFGVAGSTVASNGDMYFLGAVETQNGEKDSKQNILQGKQSQLALIKIQPYGN